jgi:hypothetical protein
MPRSLRVCSHRLANINPVALERVWNFFIDFSETQWWHGWMSSVDEVSVNHLRIPYGDLAVPRKAKFVLGVKRPFTA